MSVLICYVLYRTEKILTLNEKLCSRLLYILPVFLLAAHIQAGKVYRKEEKYTTYVKVQKNYVKYRIEESA